MIGENLAFRMGWWGANQSDTSMEISIGSGKIVQEKVVLVKVVWGKVVRKKVVWGKVV